MLAETPAAQALDRGCEGHPIWDLDIEVKPVLDLFRLGDQLKRKANIPGGLGSGGKVNLE